LRIVTPSQPPPEASDAHVIIGDSEISVDLVAHQVTVRGQDVMLTAREYDLLVYLLQHPGHAFTRAELIRTVWEWTFGDQSTVTVHVRRLREKLEADPSHPTRISTVWGVGYRLDPPASA